MVWCVLMVCVGCGFVVCVCCDVLMSGVGE